MNNNTIANPKTPVPTGLTLNEKDFTTSLLSCLKEMEKNYAIAMTEASCEYLYNEYKNIFVNISDMQREVYELMFRKGWYVLEKAENTKISSKHQTLSQEYQDLGL